MSLLQTHLLLYNGQIMLGENSSAERAIRRLFAISKDNNVMVITFDDDLTLAEAAYLAKQAGAKNVLNMDTGYYDYSSYYDKNGKQHVQGIGDKDGASNKIVVTSE